MKIKGFKEYILEDVAVNNTSNIPQVYVKSSYFLTDYMFRRNSNKFKDEWEYPEDEDF